MRVRQRQTAVMSKVNNELNMDTRVELLCVFNCNDTGASSIIQYGTAA